MSLTDDEAAVVSQAVTAGVFGLTLSVLFLAFAAPDVALSQIVVAGVAVPVMVLLALAKIRTLDRARERENGDES